MEKYVFLTKQKALLFKRMIRKYVMDLFGMQEFFPILVGFELFPVELLCFRNGQTCMR